MNIPGLTAEASLGKPTRTYRGQSRYGELASSTSAQPALALLDQPNQLDGDLDDLDLDADDGTALMDEEVMDGGVEEDGEVEDTGEADVDEDLIETTGDGDLEGTEDLDEESEEGEAA
jgi:hypothetical protein